MDENRERLTERQRYWLEHIKACEASGKRAAEYAATHGVNARALYGAKKVLVGKGVLPRTGRVRLQRVRAEAVARGSDWHIRLPNGISVEFSGAVDEGALTTVLSVAVNLG